MGHSRALCRRLGGAQRITNADPQQSTRQGANRDQNKGTVDNNSRQHYKEMYKGQNNNKYGGDNSRDAGESLNTGGELGRAAGNLNNSAHVTANGDNESGKCCNSTPETVDGSQPGKSYGSQQHKEMQISTMPQQAGETVEGGEKTQNAQGRKQSFVSQVSENVQLITHNSFEFLEGQDDEISAVPKMQNEKMSQIERRNVPTLMPRLPGPN